MFFIAQYYPFPLPFLFFLEYAGELRIFVLRRRKRSKYTRNHSPPWTREGSRSYITSRTITSKIRGRT